jgi:methyl-accepting chemotaxis protein
MEMEKLFMDIVNASIAVFKTSEDKLKSTIGDLEKVYEELKAKGQADNSENAKKLRDLLNKTVNDSKSAVNQANASYEDVLKSVQESYSNLATQIETMVPAEVKSTIQKGLDELNKLLKRD